MKTALFLFFTFPATAQQPNHIERCGTKAYNKAFYESGKQDRFESWIQSRRRMKSFSRSSTHNDVLTIPVVIHIIHRGEPVGKGTNISYERIKEQMEIINQDFRRNNPDAGKTRPQFQDVAGDAKIKFVLARKDPQGNPTDGINRVEGSKNNWDQFNDDQELKSHSYWPSQDYMNIWVAPLNQLGYAKFPRSDTITDLNNNSTNPELDGVVISSWYFGVNNEFPDDKQNSFKSYGRSATHEIGHFLGNYHPWGDVNNCSGTDYVDDTPNSETPTYSCNYDKSSCGSLDMIENFMDYTPDSCMNMFSKGQIERMRIVLKNSPRRASLLNSPALEEPGKFDNDLAIEQINKPSWNVYHNYIIPEVRVKNLGKNQVDSFKIAFQLNDSIINTRKVTTSLDTFETSNIVFDSVFFEQENINQPVTFKYQFQITSVNDSLDDQTLNNSKKSQFFRSPEASIPFKEPFNTSGSTFSDLWYKWNSSSRFEGWKISSNTGFCDSSNAAFLHFGRSSSIPFLYQYLITPVFDLSDYGSAQLTFNYSYSATDENKPDSVIVVAFPSSMSHYEPENLLQRGEILFSGSGEELETIPVFFENYAPLTKLEWKKKSINLNQFLGTKYVQFAFIGISHGGNNFYIDNIELNGTSFDEQGLTISSVISPDLVTTSTQISPRINIKNNSLQLSPQYKVVFDINNHSSDTLEGSFLQGGNNEIFDFSTVFLDEGNYNYQVKILNDSSNNILTASSGNFSVNKSKDFIPLLQDFELKSTVPDTVDTLSHILNNWTIPQPGDNPTWKIHEFTNDSLPDEKNNALMLRNFACDRNENTEDYFISPVLDFSESSEPTLIFKVAYATVLDNFSDSLKVLVTANGGETYRTVYQKGGQELATAMTLDEFYPDTVLDWRKEHIDLSEFRGESDVRVIFAFKNDRGNNIFLDNIEFFLNSEPFYESLSTVYPVPVKQHENLNVKFDFTERKDAQITIYNNMGKRFYHQNYPNTLNQNYQINTGTFNPGVYIINLKAKDYNESEKIIIRP